MVLIWLNKAVKLLSILINTLWIHRCSAFIKIYRSLRSVLLMFLVFCVLLLCVFTFWVPSCDFRIQTMVGSFFTSMLFVRGIMSYKRYLCWLANNGVQRTLCSFFACFCLVFVLYLVWHALPISMDCPFCVTTLVFSIVYWH